MSKIAVIQGHPDASSNHLCHALASAYVEGALAAGHEIEQVDVGQLNFPILRSQEDWQKGHDRTHEDLKEAQGPLWERITCF